MFEQARIVEKSAAESDGVAGDGECLREDKGRIEQALRLGGDKLRGEIHPGGGVDGAVEGGVFELEAATIPDYGYEENSGGQELLRAGEERARMRGNFRGKAAQRCGDQISRGHYGEQGAGDFAARVARTRQEMLNEQRDDEEQGENDAADPPGNWRPAQLHLGFLLELKEQKARRGEDGAGKKESCAEDQGDAVLRALKADEDDGGEHERQQAGGDLQIALQDGVGLEGNETQPHREEKKDDEPRDTRQDGSYATAAGNQCGLGHSLLFFYLGPGPYLIRL